MSDAKYFVEQNRPEMLALANLLDGMNASGIETIVQKLRNGTLLLNPADHELDRKNAEEIEAEAQKARDDAKAAHEKLAKEKADRLKPVTVPPVFKPNTAPVMAANVGQPKPGDA